ncbi:CpaD family pilus assembly protein [Oricola sp.]|uniref:CpaD family pilus assembly protein n=1 Tax=Oricola sp. TaxID=1979950 RepID=UPI003BABF811
MGMKAFFKTAAVLGLLASVAGCGSLGRDPIQVGSVPQDYRTNHPIVLSEREKTLDIPIASGQRKINIPLRSNIRAFAAAFTETGSGVLFLTMPSGSANGPAVSYLKPQIMQALADGGVPASRIATQYYDAKDHGSAAPIRLSYQAVAASVAPCGNWPEDLGETVENKNYHDYGCSTQSNLAAVVANPVDLLGPRRLSQIDATQRAAVIEDYQSGPRGAASEVRY